MFQHWRRGNTQDAACDNSRPWGHALRRGKQFLQVIGLIYCLNEHIGYVASACFRASISNSPSSDRIGGCPLLPHFFSRARSVLRWMMSWALAARITATLLNMLISSPMPGMPAITSSASESSIDTIGTDRAMAIATANISPMLEWGPRS